METTNKPIIWKSILCVVPSLAVFLITRIVLVLLLSLVMALILYIPILNKIFQAFLIFRQDSPLMLATTLSVMFAYLFTSFLQKKMMKDIPTIRLSRKILGVIIALVHVLSLVSNIIHGGNVIANIICIIAGLVFVFSDNFD